MNKQSIPKRGATNLTAAQLAAYSAEWREFFDWLLGSGYSVLYEYGVLHIENSNTKMDVQLIGSRWQMQLFGSVDTITRRSRYCEQIREMIKYSLLLHHSPLFQHNPLGRISR